MSPRALITGVAGQDGTYLTELLLGKGYEVFGLVGPAPGDTFEQWSAALRPGFTALQGDLRDEASIVEAVRAAAPDEVYNFAAISSVGDSWEQRELVWDVNLRGVERLLAALAEHAPEARFAQASSAEVFGDSGAAPASEGTPIAPISPYGESKAEAHVAIQAAAAAGQYCCNAIFYNHESPRRPVGFVTRKIADAAARIKAGVESELHLGNIYARRDWGWAPEYVDGMWRMLQLDAPSDFVFATGVAHSVAQFAETAFQHVGLEWNDYTTVDRTLFRPADAEARVGDASRAHDLLGWEAATPFAEIVGAMVDAELERLGAAR